MTRTGTKLLSFPLSIPEMTETVEMERKIVIIGSGIAGLACGKALVDAGETNFVILEAGDVPGGRIRTDEVEGYLLDRGFQVFIEEYPEAKKLFDYSTLDLKQFLPGAFVRYNGKFHKVSDPFRRPQDLLTSIGTPIGSFVDKAKVGIFSLLIRFKALDDIFGQPELDTLSYLKRTQGLSPSMIDRFFSPFYQGIFLSPLKYQSSRMFEFVFKMFTEGAAALPAGGMQNICTQVANCLPSGNLQLNTKVFSAKDGRIEAFNGATGKKERWSCESVVLAVDPPTASKLTGGKVEIPDARKSTCLYYGFDGPPPITEPLLILNGENAFDDFEPASTTINNICFPSSVSSKYAPEGKSLASVTVVGSADGVSDSELETSIRQQLEDWFGVETTATWKFLKSYRVLYAQPAQTPPYSIEGAPIRLTESLLICGDHRGTATLNGAIESGRRAAQCLLES